MTDHLRVSDHLRPHREMQFMAPTKREDEGTSLATPHMETSGEGTRRLRIARISSNAQILLQLEHREILNTGFYDASDATSERTPRGDFPEKQRGDDPEGPPPPICYFRPDISGSIIKLGNVLAECSPVSSDVPSRRHLSPFGVAAKRISINGKLCFRGSS